MDRTCPQWEMHMKFNRNREFLRFVVENAEGGGGGGETPPADPPAGDPPAGDPPPAGEESLGDPGKKAIDAMKAERNTARQEARDLKAQMAALQAQIDAQGKPPEEQALDAARREAREEVMKEANGKLIKAEIRAAAAGKLADPTDALRLLDLGSFEVAGDGTIDTEAISDAIDNLIEKKPYLASQRQRSGGSADGGTRNADASGKQLTRADLHGMTPEAIEAARVAGKLNRLLGISA